MRTIETLSFKVAHSKALLQAVVVHKEGHPYCITAIQTTVT